MHSILIGELPSLGNERLTPLVVLLGCLPTMNYLLDNRYQCTSLLHIALGHLLLLILSKVINSFNPNISANISNPHIGRASASTSMQTWPCPA